MTQLERTIKRILAERNKAANQEKIRDEAELTVVQKTRYYSKEFDSLYRQIEAIEQIEREFVAWADHCKIDDARKEVVDGNGFYQHLLRGAHIAYQRFREEGYEPQTAFDKGTANLTRWIEGSTKQSSGGILYLNHSQEFLHRLREI